MLRIIMLYVIAVSHVSAAESVLFGNISDMRLMSKVEKLGELENGLSIFSWQWTEVATEIDPRYGKIEEDGGFLSIGFIAQNVRKTYPGAVEVGVDGYLRINEQELAKSDQFIRWKLTSDSNSIEGRCAKILGSGFILCF